MSPNRASNPGPLVLESDLLPTALCGPATSVKAKIVKILKESPVFCYSFIQQLY